tara:strand:- start:8328 stop:9596 length:1269 start_codon:yes stop_codon:yes gene_type:complete
VAKHSLTESFEAIDVQRNSPLFNELSIHVQEYLDTPQPDRKAFATFGKRVTNSIKVHSGIKVKLDLSPQNIPNAYVLIPQIDRNHPLLVDYFREVSDNRDGIKLVRKNDGVFEGAIDRSKARVSGGFADFEVKMGITRGLLTERFSAGEVAGIILHELGHIFTYFEYLGTSITTNYVLQHVSRSLLDTRETKRKYQIIKEGSDALGIEIEDPDALIRSQNETVIQTVLLREVASKRYSEMNSHTYDMTAWEMLSDQFATRHGAGRSLVTALDKMYRTYGAVEYKNTSGYLMTEAFKLLLFIISIPLTFALVPFLLLVVIDPNEDLYDKPKSRLLRIQRDMIDASKNRDVDQDYQKQLVQDIEVIDRVVEEMEERRTLLEMFWITVRPRTRHNYKQLRFQQELEMLVNNSLFVKSAKLKTLSL